MSDQAFDLSAMIDALERLVRAGVPNVDRSPSAAMRLMVEWKRNERMATLTAEQLARCVDAWIAAQSSPRSARMPTPAMLLQARAEEYRGQQRVEQARHGGQVPDAVRSERGEFTGWVTRVFGREWTQGGRWYREFITAFDHPGHSAEIPRRLFEAGYTVELPVPPHRSPEGVGLAWRGDRAPDHGRFGAPRLKVSLSAERGRARADG